MINYGLPTQEGDDQKDDLELLRALINKTVKLEDKGPEQADSTKVLERFIS